MKSGSFNFLESPGPVQACTGIVLLFTLRERKLSAEGQRLMNGCRIRTGLKQDSVQVIFLQTYNFLRLILSRMFIK